VPLAQAQDYRLPAPGVMVHLSPEFNPPILRGIKVHPDNPFLFDFILDQGDGVIASEAKQSQQEQLKNEATRFIKYFLASLTIPEKDLWVNLSPYEKDRIIPNSFGLTEMGRDLLAEDYMLKQITASLIYPEDEIGKKFWKRIYEEAAKKFGTTNIPVNTFNKVWIVPEKAVVYENAKAGTAYVVESKLKVMLEQDYLSMSKHADVGVTEGGVSPAAHNEVRTDGETRGQDPNINRLGSQIIREIVIPELTTEVNENKNFAQLRQVYNSLILATWYKKKIKDSILSQVYADKNKVTGVNIDDPQEKEKIYQRYLQAFKKGVYNYIKEEQDPLTQEMIPRKYFSGGFDLDLAMNPISGMPRLQISHDEAMLPEGFNDQAMVVVTAGIKLAQEFLNKLDSGLVELKQWPEYKRMQDIGIIENNRQRDEKIEKGEFVDINQTLNDINSIGLLKFVLDPSKKPSPYVDPLLQMRFKELNHDVITALTAKGVESLLSQLPEIKITSLNRTLEEQKILIAKGFPAASGDKSAHLRGLAMDLNFRDYFDAIDGKKLPESFRDLSPQELNKKKELMTLVLRTFWEVAREMEKEGTAHYISENRNSVLDTLKGMVGLKWPSRPLLHFAAMPPAKAKNGEDSPLNRKGGIDLSPANMNLQTQNGGKAIKFHLDPAQFQQLQNAPGFVPVIINIQPMTNLRMFLGLTDNQSTSQHGDLP